MTPVAKLEEAIKAGAESVRPEELRDRAKQAGADLGEAVGQLAAKADLGRKARRRAVRAELMARDTVTRAAEEVRARTAQRVWAAAQRATPTKRRGFAGLLAAGAAALVAMAAVVTLRRPQPENAEEAQK